MHGLDIIASLNGGDVTPVTRRATQDGDRWSHGFEQARRPILLSEGDLKEWRRRNARHLAK